MSAKISQRSPLGHRQSSQRPQAEFCSVWTEPVFELKLSVIPVEWPILRHQDWQWGVCNRLGVGGNEIRVNLILVVGPWVNELTFCTSISHLWNECNILSPTRWLWRLTKVHTQTPAWRLAGARQLCQPKGMQRAERSVDPQSPVHWPSKPVQVVRLASGLGWLRG